MPVQVKAHQRVVEENPITGKKKVSEVKAHLRRKTEEIPLAEKREKWLKEVKKRVKNMKK